MCPLNQVLNKKSSVSKISNNVLQLFRSASSKIAFFTCFQQKTIGAVENFMFFNISIIFTPLGKLRTPKKREMNFDIPQGCYRINLLTLLNIFHRNKVPFKRRVEEQSWIQTHETESWLFVILEIYTLILYTDKILNIISQRYFFHSNFWRFLLYDPKKYIHTVF